MRAMRWVVGQHGSRVPAEPCAPRDREVLSPSRAARCTTRPPAASPAVCIGAVLATSQLGARREGRDTGESGGSVASSGANESGECPWSTGGRLLDPGSQRLLTNSDHAQPGRIRRESSLRMQPGPDESAAVEVQPGRVRSALGDPLGGSPQQNGPASRRRGGGGAAGPPGARRDPIARGRPGLPRSRGARGARGHRSTGARRAGGAGRATSAARERGTAGRPTRIPRRGGNRVAGRSTSGARQVTGTTNVTPGTGTRGRR